MKKIQKFWIFLLCVSLLVFCRESKVRENEAQVALRQKMLQFFTPPNSSGTIFSGLWRAEQSSLEKAIENRYLKQYKAQPDEASREVLRERLKGIRTYLRIEQNRAEMLTFSPEGGIGVNIGELTVKGMQGKLFLKGKEGSSTLVTLIRKSIEGREVLEYHEEGNVILFKREEESAEKLTQQILEKMQNMLALPEY